MPNPGFFATRGSAVVLAAAIAASGAGQTPPQPAAAPTQAQQPQTLQSGYVLKVKTRLVSLDVIATDSHGNVVRDLKPEELQIFAEHNQKQDIAQFEFIDRLNGTGALGSPAAEPASKGIYSNQALFQHLTIPPTVILMDALNSPMESQIQARKHMLRLLQTLPSDTPIAVFLMGHTLRLVQGFTSDPALLRAAVNKAMSPSTIEQDPQDDPDSIENSDAADSDDDDPTETAMIERIEDFEKEYYAATIDTRVQTTLDSLTAIARFLSGVPGRKNLIWLSEAFPFYIAPNTDTGLDVFAGTRNYSDKIQSAADALTDAQVAVYPLDISGLQAPQAFAAAAPSNVGRGRGNPMMARLSREQVARLTAEGTMEELAGDTGGKVCENTNDLSGCVKAALKNSAAYYELAFYPRDVKWDGKFQRIEVKTSRRGVKLTYRRGYFALDGDTLAKTQKPEDRLHQACSDPLPSTAIGLTARPVTPAGLAMQKYELAYLLLIAPGETSFVQSGDSREMRIQVAMCDFGAKGDSFRFYSQNIAQKVTDELLATRQSQGIPQIVTINASAHTERVRIAVLDEPTGLVGALDIPVRPEDLEKASASAAAAAPTVAAALELPDKDDPAESTEAPKSMGSLIFHGESGQSAALDWNGEGLVYQGDLTIDQTAPAFFAYAFAAKVRCAAGSAVTNATGAGEAQLRATFRNHEGKTLTVDLKGAQPQYSGDLPADANVKLFFDQVWLLAHCVNR